MWMIHIVEEITAVARYLKQRYLPGDVECKGVYCLVLH
jgi:hypothetical protein